MRTECLEDGNEPADQNSKLLDLPWRSYQTRMWNRPNIARTVGALSLLASLSRLLFLSLFVPIWWDVVVKLSRGEIIELCRQSRCLGFFTRKSSTGGSCHSIWVSCCVRKRHILHLPLPLEHPFVALPESPLSLRPKGDIKPVSRNQVKKEAILKKFQD
jgi:hypothetical protein